MNNPTVKLYLDSIIKCWFGLWTKSTCSLFIITKTNRPKLLRKSGFVNKHGTDKHIDEEILISTMTQTKKKKKHAGYWTA